jgi:hypothetical protein
MGRRRITGFVDARSGEWCDLREPDGPPSARQLWRLNQLGMLELVPPGQAAPLTKGEAAAAIDDAAERKQEDREVDDLARIVAARQGEPTAEALFVSIHLNRDPSPLIDTAYRCGHRYDEWSARWNARKRGVWSDTACRVCLPEMIEAGEVVLDLRSAQETLAVMRRRASLRLVSDEEAFPF